MKILRMFKLTVSLLYIYRRAHTNIGTIGAYRHIVTNVDPTLLDLWQIDNSSNCEYTWVLSKKKNLEDVLFLFFFFNYLLLLKALKCEPSQCDFIRDKIRSLLLFRSQLLFSHWHFFFANLSAEIKNEHSEIFNENSYKLFYFISFRIISNNPDIFNLKKIIK
jgi:hypothetical protein